MFVVSSRVVCGCVWAGLLCYAGGFWWILGVICFCVVFMCFVIDCLCWFWIVGWWFCCGCLWWAWLLHGDVVSAGEFRVRQAWVFS